MNKKKQKLTRIQEETLGVIKLFYKRHGIMPTYGELGEALGICDSGAYTNCRKLAEKGWIKQDRRPRMMKIL